MLKRSPASRKAAADTRPVKTPGQPEWRDYRDNDTASMQFGPVTRAIVGG